MPILLNGEVIPRELIQEEERRLAESPEWKALPDALEKRMSLRQAAEASVIDRVLLRQQTDQDPRPIDAVLVAAQVQHLTAAQSCRVLFDEGPHALRFAGRQRMEPTRREL